MLLDDPKDVAGPMNGSSGADDVLRKTILANAAISVRETPALPDGASASRQRRTNAR